MHLAILQSFTFFSLNYIFFFFSTVSMFLVFGLSTMFNTIGGQLGERLNAFLATCPAVVIHILCYYLGFLWQIKWWWWWWWWWWYCNNSIDIENRLAVVTLLLLQILFLQILLYVILQSNYTRNNVHNVKSYIKQIDSTVSCCDWSYNNIIIA